MACRRQPRLRTWRSVSYASGPADWANSVAGERPNGLKLCPGDPSPRRQARCPRGTRPRESHRPSAVRRQGRAPRAPQAGRCLGACWWDLRNSSTLTPHRRQIGEVREEPPTAHSRGAPRPKDRPGEAPCAEVARAWHGCHGRGTLTLGPGLPTGLWSRPLFLWIEGSHDDPMSQRLYIPGLPCGPGLN